MLLDPDLVRSKMFRFGISGPMLHPVWWCWPASDRGHVVPLLIADAGLGLLVSQLNNYTLSPISDERVSEAAGVNSAGGSLGLAQGMPTRMIWIILAALGVPIWLVVGMLVRPSGVGGGSAPSPVSSRARSSAPTTRGGPAPPPLPRGSMTSCSSTEDRPW
jgi:hypothetical protein